MSFVSFLNEREEENCTDQNIYTIILEKSTSKTKKKSDYFYKFLTISLSDLFSYVELFSWKKRLINL